jgi:hypothetical protein
VVRLNALLRHPNDQSARQEDMMNLLLTIPRSLNLVLALAALAAMPLAAQNNTSQKLNDHLADEMKARAGQLVVDYWTPKLNDYKVRIDRILSPSDLDALNQYRVRFSMVMEDHLQEKAARKSSTTSRQTPSRMKIDNDAQMRKATDFMEIYSGTKDLASNYQEDLRLLGLTVIDDVIAFTDQLVQNSTDFISVHRAEMTPEQISEFNDKIRAFSETIAELKADRDGQMGLAAIYSFAVEPIIMLYNGTELTELLQQLGGVAKPVAGLDLPASSVLAQNFPNPATMKTTISYNLNDASNTTVLRLFNADGSVVQTLDLGSLPAGAHSIDLDVSNLASGSYLYQLSIVTASGEQVFAKRMQVVR